MGRRVLSWIIGNRNMGGGLRRRREQMNYKQDYLHLDINTS
jgi:hypothetical protein